MDFDKTNLPLDHWWLKKVKFCERIYILIKGLIKVFEMDKLFFGLSWMEHLYMIVFIDRIHSDNLFQGIFGFANLQIWLTVFCILQMKMLIYHFLDPLNLEVGHIIWPISVLYCLYVHVVLDAFFRTWLWGFSQFFAWVQRTIGSTVCYSEKNLNLGL